MLNEVKVTASDYLVDNEVVYEVSTTEGQVVAVLATHEDAVATAEYLMTTEIGQWLIG